MNLFTIISSKHYEKWNCESVVVLYARCNLLLIVVLKQQFSGVNFDFRCHNFQTHETVPQSMHILYISLLIARSNLIKCKGANPQCIEMYAFCGHEGKRAFVIWRFVCMRFAGWEVKGFVFEATGRN